MSGLITRPQSFGGGGLIDLNGVPLAPIKMVPNPMLEYPPYWKCWCGKEKNAKSCCLPKMAKMIPEKEAPLGLKYMAYVKEHFGKETHL